MNTEQARDLAELAARIARAYPKLHPYGCANVALAFCRAERAQMLGALRHCNISEEYAGRSYRRATTLAAKAVEMLSDVSREVGVPVLKFQNDPRGAVLLLRLPGEPEAVSV